MTTTEHKPMRVMVIGAGINAAATVALLEAVRGIEVVPPLLVEDTPKRLGLPELREPEPIQPCWDSATGKQTAQWKREMNGRKRK
jgi:hypothetical protein